MSISINIEQIMDRLDEAEARLKVLMLENEELSDLVEEYQDGKLEMKVRAENAERERDVLADVLESTGGEFACCIDCPFPKKREIVCRDRQDDLPEKQCWLEWALQQARGGEI